ncbi:hypothetical protein GCM10023093_18150 [Nemorincola caseinilytica]|uniref:Permuted papain-like amidase YaeF/Yiix C92 family enzyme n=1 Tax=Nemorincola caseinilytica TaxID=2054315 RepID=A0ABP8NFT8_9BACT
MRALAAILTMLVICGGLMVFAGRLYLAEQRKMQAAHAPGTTDSIRNKHAADSLVALLRSGDVVLRTGAGAFSRAFAGFNRRDKSYSHCGIVMIENGRPYVYHCIGGDGDTTACIRRETAQHFFSPAYNTAAAIARYPFADTTIALLASTIRSYAARRPVFDTRFDLQSNDKLYCTEFVYKTIVQATGDSAYLPVTHIPAGTFVGTDDLFLNAHATLIGSVRYY